MPAYLSKRAVSNAALSALMLFALLLAGCQSLPEAATTQHVTSSEITRNKSDEFETRRKAERCARADEIRNEVAEIKLKAEAGDAEALYRLGTWYDLGNEVCDETLVPKDLKLAEEWYLKSAAGGYARGYYGVGCIMYKTGGRRRAQEALSFLQTAADLGVIDAKAQIAKYYWHGLVYEQDYDSALSWVLHTLDSVNREYDDHLDRSIALSFVLLDFTSDRCGPALPRLPAPKTPKHPPGLRF